MLYMGSQEKCIYEAPATIVVEVAQEGVVCTSTGTNGTPTYHPFNNEQTW